MGTEIGSGGAERVAQALDALKRTGSNVLLVGAGTSDGHDAVCRRLGGDLAHDSRYQVFVTDPATAGPTDCHAAGTRRTIEYEPTSNRQKSAVRAPLETLGVDVIETIDEFDADANGLEAGELRVCVRSLATLLQEHEAEHVFRLVHVLRSRIEQARGIGHYHLPVSPDHDAVRLLEPMFDATVDLRASDGVHEHRWHLRDREMRTDWIRL